MKRTHEDAEAGRATAPPRDLYEEQPRSILGDVHARRCLRLRRALPRLEMPCARATAEVGVLLMRKGVPRDVVRDVYALARGLRDPKDPAVVAASDDAFLAAGPLRESAEGFDGPFPNPPLIPGALKKALREALSGRAGLTDVGRSLTLLAEAPEAYHLSEIYGCDGPPDALYAPLFPWEATFPGLVGCSTLTVRSTVGVERDVSMGGDARRMLETSYEHAERGTFALPPAERTFASPRHARGAYFTVAELALAATSLPESWRHLPRYYDLTFCETGGDPYLSQGRFKKLKRPDAYYQTYFMTGRKPSADFKLVPSDPARAPILVKMDTSLEVGRSRESDVWFAEAFISRRHATLVADDSRLFLSIPAGAHATTPIAVRGTRQLAPGTRTELRPGDAFSFYAGDRSFAYTVDTTEDDCDATFAPATLATDLGRATFALAEDDASHGVLSVEWEVSHGGAFGNESISFWDEPALCDKPAAVLGAWDAAEELRGDGGGLVALRERCVDREKWAPEYDRDAY